MNYRSAERDLGDRSSRKVGNNTYLERDPWSPNTINLRLHNTRIVGFHDDGSITLNSGGWQTVTTKDRMNWVSGIRVYQEDFRWYVVVGRNWNNPIPFDDGMVITP